uniref:Membrane protein n=1 Tax=Pithovirus LCPAC001 TaxID=2506585 RepID=A0A481Z1N2_9VIRU|nr:MAG: membrane protein [Pithovirus LCPAC001]
MSNTTNLDDMSTDQDHHHRGYGGGVIWLLWFIVIVIVIWLILFATKPTWVQKTDEHGKPTGEVDSGKALLWAIVITIIICVLVWIFTSLGNGRYGYRPKY